MRDWGRGGNGSPLCACLRCVALRCPRSETVVERRGRLIAQCLVETLFVVEAHVEANGDPRFGDAVIGVEVDLLVFHRAPQPLHEDVVDW